MDEIIIQTLVERIDDQGKAIQEIKGQLSGHQEAITHTVSHIDEVERDCKTILQDITFPLQEIQQLTERISMLATLLRLPLKKEVSHHHYVHKAIWVAAGLLVLVVIQFTLLTKTWSKNEGERASDLKYRFLKLSTDTGSQRLLFHVDSLYLQDADRFKKNVLEEEGELKRLKEKIRKK